MYLKIFLGKAWPNEIRLYKYIKSCIHHNTWLTGLMTLLEV